MMESLTSQETDHVIRCAIPVLHVVGSTDAEEFYCTRLGFRREFAFRPDPT